MKSTKVFCDEAGFTGNKMLDEQQPYFTYSAVTIEPDEAAEFVTSIIHDFGVQGGELKSSNLLKYNKGRRAISKVLDHLDGRYHAVVHHKKYSLACKFFEYIFEPVLQGNNSLFYKHNFHLHIANLLHMHFETRMSGAEEIMTDFETFMRRRDTEGLKALFAPTTTNPDAANALTYLMEFALGYRDTILDEIDHLSSNDGAGKWVLELTLTSVFGLLGRLAEDHEILDVYCDESKPLLSSSSLFDTLVGRQDRTRMHAFGKNRLITWNMEKPIQLVSSHDVPAIQLADIVSGALSYSVRKRGENASKEWLAKITPNLIDECVIPDLKAVDLEQDEAFINAAVLMQLAERARMGMDPLKGMVEYYQNAEYQLAINPPSYRIKKKPN